MDTSLSLVGEQIGVHFFQPTLQLPMMIFLSNLGLAPEEVTDIAKEVLVGSVRISVTIDKDILMSFCTLVPTAENNWDFGLAIKPRSSFSCLTQ